MGDRKRSVLLVDDEQNILLALKRELHEWARERGLEIVLRGSAAEGLAYLASGEEETILVVSDLRMPEMKGSDFLLKVRELYPDIVSLLLTGYSEAAEIVKAVSAGIFSFMLKPWDRAALIAELQKAYDYRELRAQNESYLKRLEEELRWAGEFQKTILRPNIPGSANVEFRASYRPVPRLYCGGDYYDVIAVGQDRYLLLIGDVAGHGVKAAFITGILKAVIFPEYVRALVGKPISPGEFLSWLNSRMQFELRSSTSTIITFFAGYLDLTSRTLTYANAGHTHPFLARANAVEELLVSGTAIGSGHDRLMYTEQHVSLRPLDTLFFYTDGLMEVGQGIKVGSILERVSYGDEYHLRVLQAALEAGGATEFADDVTILTARLR